MTTPLTLWRGILLDQVLVDGAASLVNLVIHAVLLGAVVWTVRIAVKDTFVPSFLQYTIIIVFTGTLLVAGYFVEVLVWAVAYLVGLGATQCRSRRSSPSALDDPRRCRLGCARAVAAA